MHLPARFVRTSSFILCFGLVLGLLSLASESIAFGQEAQGVPANELEELASNARAPAAATSPNPPPSAGIDFFSLLLRGGIFMIPIAMVSLLALTFAVERLLMLRRGRILPRALVRGLGKIARESETLDPKAAYKLCQQYPSAASNIIRTMLLKVGRPHSEVEAAVKEATQREAEKLYNNVRWLNLATGVAPLLGLLGTVWGLIVAFHDSTQLGVTSNRAEHLARGIYEALVTTLAGLMVAIPSAMISHFFEGKISESFRQIDELMFHLLAQIERYEGRVRFDTIGKELISRDLSAPSTQPNPATSSGTASPLSNPSAVDAALARSPKSTSSSGSGAVPGRTRPT